eukprot:TRINITY_DN2380_c0_g1_i2.p1 TRINITY_DN2380_c0_g1~~TRINITY_DN2380_c0_g1_i2.p1  ORF type:complete len:475 (+),score=104.46 TRINITY_DN2380_c0_g1_i2:76-1500(+)
MAMVGKACMQPSRRARLFSSISKSDVSRIRSDYVHPSIGGFTMFKDDPVHLSHGKMQYLYDVDGRKYLDAFGGICTVGVGHCHPVLNKALHEQTEKLWHHSALYISDSMHQYAERLVKRIGRPDRLNKVYFVNSGSEANDLAMQMARVYTGNDLVVGLRNGYHGMGTGVTMLTSHSTWRHGESAGIMHVMNPDPLHGPFGGKRDGQVVRTDRPDLPHDDAHLLYANELRQSLLYGSSSRIAGLFAEPIQGVGGAMQLCDGYMEAAFKIAREAGGLCIADEVQSGFARLGSHYWGFEMQGVEPDIVVMAKSIGNGFPLAAVVTRSDVAEAFSKKLHFNTYGGNPMASAVGLAVLDVIEQEGVQENCLVVGKKLRDGLLDAQTRWPEFIADVRGRGLMQGVEFWRPGAKHAAQTPAPGSDDTLKIVNLMKHKGILVGRGGLFGSVMRIKPPMCWNVADADFFLAAFNEACEEVYGK